MSEQENTVEGVLDICAHRVRWWYDVGRCRLSEADKHELELGAEERAKACIIEGYVEGELCAYVERKGTKEFYGAWHIER